MKSKISIKPDDKLYMYIANQSELQKLSDSTYKL